MVIEKVEDEMRSHKYESRVLFFAQILQINELADRYSLIVKSENLNYINKGICSQVFIILRQNERVGV